MSDKRAPGMARARQDWRATRKTRAIAWARQSDRMARLCGDQDAHTDPRGWRA